MAIVAFTDATGRGIVGQHKNSEEWNAISRLADGVAANPIGFGQPVYRVAGNDKLVSTAINGDPVGVTRYRIDVDAVAGYKGGNTVSVMTNGVMIVAAGSAATAGANAGYDPATDRWGDVAGAFAAVPGVEFDTNSTAGNIVEIRIIRAAN